MPYLKSYSVTVISIEVDYELSLDRLEQRWDVRRSRHERLERWSKYNQSMSYVATSYAKMFGREVLSIDGNESLEEAYKSLVYHLEYILSSQSKKEEKQ